ncbi:MAG: hypothetical protein WCP53_11425, partial [Verrucomicrobiota bacterium]
AMEPSTRSRTNPSPASAPAVRGVSRIREGAGLTFDDHLVVAGADAITVALSIWAAIVVAWIRNDLHCRARVLLTVAVIARIPEKPDDRNGFAQYQGLSYHDTPRPDPPALRFVDTGAPTDRRSSYAVSIVNGSGLEGPRGRAKKVPAGK